MCPRKNQRIHLVDYKVLLGSIGIETWSLLQWWSPDGWRDCAFYERFPYSCGVLILKLENIDTTAYEIFDPAEL